MTLSSLQIKLVIVLPSFLFLMGFLFKGILEKHNLKKIYKIMLNDKIKTNLNYCEIVPEIGEIFHSLMYDFIYIFSMESIFLIVANGLIIIFELGKIELGIILIIVGLIFSLFTSIGSHVRDISSLSIGLVLTMILIGAELGYFISYDLEKIWIISVYEFIMITSILSASLSVIVMSNFDLSDYKYNLLLSILSKLKNILVDLKKYIK